MTERIRYTLGVDIGGTFTDIVLQGSDGSIATNKVLSTADDYAKGIMAGVSAVLQELAVARTAIDGVVHGTTVATNAILEGKGAKTALITTAGFRDILELRRIRIPQLYNLFYDKPAPLVPRRLRFEVPERIGPRGEIDLPLDEARVRLIVEKVGAAEAQALAICFLHSYINPEHERRVAKIAREILPDVFISCSADILPEIREYERTSTTVINAYVGPIVGHYLRSLAQHFRRAGINAPVRIMQSNGGVMTAEAATEKPAYIVESGPAAGVIASAHMARRAGVSNLITLDMGGTTAKSSMIENGTITKTSEYEAGAGINLSSQLVKGGGYALKLPLIDISEIGAGGGSLVSINKGGLLQIGPQSAGAVPGPVCYDAGGEDPTLTDAHVILGYINPKHLAGGHVRLNVQKAKRVFERKVAEPLGMPALEAAYGVHAIASATMMRAVKAVSTYRGRDPREFALMAFGGNGPICGVELARMLQMKRVLIPPCPGLFSAFGLLLATIEHQFTQSCFRRAGAISVGELNTLYAALEQKAHAVLAQEGVEQHDVAIHRYADLRYSGQAYELTVSVPGRLLSPAQVPEIIENFEAEHFRTYGHRAINEPVDLVSLRVSAATRESHTSFVPYAAGGARAAQTDASGERFAYFGPGFGLLPAPVLNGRDLIHGARRGPVIVEEYDATCVVPPGCEASLDEWNNIVIDIGQE